MKQSIKFAIAVLAAAFATAGIAAEAAKSIRGTEPAIADSQFTAKEYLGNKPGQQEVVARTFDGQPPVIPHAVTNFDEITLEENQCMDCHGPENYVEKKSPKVGDSHFMDRNGKVSKQVSRLRYECVMCHVPQSDAPPLVDNTFKGQVTAAKTTKIQTK